MPEVVPRWVAASAVAGSLWVLGGPIGWLLGGFVLAAAVRGRPGANLLGFAHAGAVIAAFLLAVPVSLTLGFAAGGVVAGAVVGASHGAVLRPPALLWSLAGALAGGWTGNLLIDSLAWSATGRLGVGALAGAVYGLATAWPLTRGVVPAAS